jgi:glycosyltransferase involved in cell wall biosynthesis
MANLFIRTNIAPYRVDTYNALHERLDMKMCFYRRKGKAQMFDIDQLEGQCTFQPVYLKGIRLKSDNRKICLGLWRMLWQERPKIVIVPEFQISAMQVLLFRWLTRRKFKVVSMTDDSYDMIANNNDFTQLHAWLRTHTAKYFDDFIVVTPEVERWYQQYFHRGIWLPIIMDDAKAEANYDRLLQLSRQLAERYGLIGKKVLLSVSRLVDLKNLHRVIDAFEQSKSDAILVIVGDGPEREALEQHAKSINKKVLFTGRFDGDELYAWYNLSNVFILASYLEAFGAVTNEALLAGSRVIVSRKAGSSCLVNEENGELIDPIDVECIAEAIDRQMALASIPNLEAARKSLMTVSFEERICNVVNKLKNEGENGKY